ncbi:MAG: GNAT family N-acetyltransferase [Bacilli bacterium]|nr:GNAT family N-acetyltransferase [Bacilli bacterium]
MYHKKLEGKRIYLSPMNIEDAETYIKWLADRRVSDGTNATCKLYNIVSEKEWIEKNMERGEYTFSIVSKDNNKLIGNCGIMNPNFIHGTATLGIFIGEEEYRGKGIGKEVLELLLDYGFNFLRLHNIKLDVFSFNKQAIDCYKRIGFKEYGIRHECYFLDGKWYDELSMEILEKDYRNVNLVDM